MRIFRFDSAKANKTVTDVSNVRVPWKGTSIYINGRNGSLCATLNNDNGTHIQAYENCLDPLKYFYCEFLNLERKYSVCIVLCLSKINTFSGSSTASDCGTCCLLWNTCCQLNFFQVSEINLLSQAKQKLHRCQVELLKQQNDSLRHQRSISLGWKTRTLEICKQSTWKQHWNISTYQRSGWKRMFQH